MYFDVSLLSEKRVCIFTLHAEWDTPEGVEARAAATQRILGDATESLFLILDMSQVKMTVDGVLRSANRFGRGPNAPFHHPMCRGVALVTNESVAQVVARGLRTETFGNLAVCVCSTLEEAMEKAAPQS